MQTTKKCCSIHGIPLARLFDLAYKKHGGATMVRQINVRYHCRVCRAKEEFEKIRASIPKRM